ncbi:hypothetical protein J437_LFUL018388 [Ladona fulva]|uniref:PiggyBac transposable element-derived protein domain-containing protein n=1 Tax=Ladona fulva TaxID=123851 RepID=A0A8K0KQS4_LADFU|nr:hypothetical protein J437_LFUL018388 [Ladona fulva]
MDYFLLFFNADLVAFIVNETNNYGEVNANSKDLSPKSRIQSWEKLTCNEFYVFLALCFLMPHVRKHSIPEYWSQDPLIRTTIFGKCMPRDLFILISRCLHSADSGKPSLSDPLWKIKYVFSQLKQRFSDVFHLYKKLVIDESLQYIPSKRHRFGMKLFILCDCESGIVLDMIVYTGKKTDISRCGELRLSGEVVKKLMGNYLGKGHILYTNNYYRSPNLCDFLLKNKTGSCGTVRVN